jgi:purine-binding chemotaxis protein CheW
MIEQSPKFGSNIASHFIKGLGKRDGKFIIILNMNQIFSTEEIISLESAADSSVSKPA